MKWSAGQGKGSQQRKTEVKGGSRLPTQPTHTHGRDPLCTNISPLFVSPFLADGRGRWSKPHSFLWVRRHNGDKKWGRYEGVFHGSLLEEEAFRKTEAYTGDQAPTQTTTQKWWDVHFPECKLLYDPYSSQVTGDWLDIFWNKWLNLKVRLYSETSRMTWLCTYSALGMNHYLVKDVCLSLLGVLYWEFLLNIAACSCLVFIHCITCWWALWEGRLMTHLLSPCNKSFVPTE